MTPIPGRALELRAKLHTWGPASTHQTGNTIAQARLIGGFVSWSQIRLLGSTKMTGLHFLGKIAVCIQVHGVSILQALG